MNICLLKTILLILCVLKSFCYQKMFFKIDYMFITLKILRLCSIYTATVLKIYNICNIRYFQYCNVRIYPESIFARIYVKKSIMLKNSQTSSNINKYTHKTQIFVWFLFFLNLNICFKKYFLDRKIFLNLISK